MTIEEIRSRKEDQTFDFVKNVAVNAENVAVNVENVAVNAENVALNAENVALNTKSLAEHWDLNR